MNILKKLILSLFALLSFSASAIQTQTGTVLYMIDQYGGAMIVYLTGGSVTGSAPGCATVPARFAIGTTTNAGLSNAAAIRYAAALGKTVTIVGAGSCGAWTDTETAATIQVNN